MSYHSVFPLAMSLQLMPMFTCLNTATRSTVSTGHALPRLWLGPRPPTTFSSHSAALTGSNLSIKPHLMLSRVSLLTYLLLTHPVPSLRRSPSGQSTATLCRFGRGRGGGAVALMYLPSPTLPTLLGVPDYTLAPPPCNLSTC